MNRHARVLGAMVLVFMLPIATVIGGGTEESGASVDAVKLNPPGAMPIVEEQVTLKGVVSPAANVTDFKTNTMTLWMEEQTNVFVDWEIIEGDESRQKAILMLNSGETLPDFFMATGFSSDDLLLYGSQGYFLSLNDYIESDSVYLKKWFMKDDGYRKQLLSADGNIYTFGSWNECYHCSYAQKMYLNKTWSDNLGFDVPETTEDFHQLLRAFKENDPNGNGKADEIPLSTATGWWHSDPVPYLMCAFIYTDGGDKLNVVGDQVIAAFTQDEYKEGLKYIAMLWDEDLIDKQSYIQNVDQLKQLVEADVIRLGAAPIGHFSGFGDMTGEGVKNFYAIPPLKGPNGVRTSGYYPTTVSSNPGFVITKDSKMPQVAFRWGDFLLNDEAWIRAFVGEKGVDWFEAGPGMVNQFGKQAKVRLDYYIMERSQQNKAWGGALPWWRSDQDDSPIAVVNDDPFYADNRHYSEPKLYAPYTPEKVVPPLPFSEEDAKTLSRIKPDVDGLVREFEVKFVTGELDIDAEWDRYLTELDKAGLEQYLEIVNRTYTKYMNQ